MVTISLCMIVKNEELTLARCLESVKNIVDEIIIVDTGSTDRTKEIAQKYTNKIYDFKWEDDFSKARNYSFSKASKKYIMWLDADDVILEKDRKKLINLKKNFDKKVDSIMLKYDLALDDQGMPALSFYRERIVRNNFNCKWQGRVHEVLKVSGKVEKVNISVTHMKLKASDPKRNLKIFQDMVKNNEEFDARQTFYYARELYYNKLYNEAIIEYNKFFLMKDAWVENKISACIDLYNLYNDLGDENRAISFALKTFKYDIPRGEACCLLGIYFMKNKNYNSAIYWFKEAKSNNINESNGGFYIKDSYTFIPAINLAVCYFYLGNIKLAKKYNEEAGLFRPKSKLYLENKKFFGY